MKHLDEIKTFRNEREWRSAVQNSHGDVDFSKCSKTGKTLSHNSKGKQVGSFKFLNITPNSTIGQGEIVQEENKNTLEESQEHNHIMQYLADKDINSKIENGKVVVHKSNLNKTKVHVKRLGHDLEVTSGLNESVELAENAMAHYNNGYEAKKAGKTRAHNPYKEGSIAAHYWAQGWSHSSDNKPKSKFTNEEVELEEKQLSRGYKENKISGKDPIPTKSAEKDPEEVNEISKATLGRYLKKSKTDIENKNYKSGAYAHSSAVAASHGHDKEAEHYDNERREIDSKSDKRSKNMNKAIDKLTKEDIQETPLSKYLNTYQDINESLGENATISDWLKHFQRSNDNRFYGKDKSQRTTEAIGAYYANHDLASINEDFASIPTTLLDEVSKVTSKMYINNLVKVAVKEKE